MIANVVANSTVPVIETGTGNCHVYVDETADISMAADIIENAKTQRMGVCNACESLVIHSGMLEKALLPIVKKLSEHGIEIRGDERVREICPEIKAASQDDWGTEYLDAIISVKTVDSIDEAISHINKYNTGHSESIITNDYNHALKFQDEIDAAAVYVNASTRFTDGFEFGFGAEIGVSTLLFLLSLQLLPALLQPLLLPLQQLLLPYLLCSCSLSPAFYLPIITLWVLYYKSHPTHFAAFSASS